MIRWWFTVSIDSSLECLHCVDVGSFLDVLEVHAGSVFRVELCRVGEFPCIRRCLFGSWGMGVGVGV